MDCLSFHHYLLIVRKPIILGAFNPSKNTKKNPDQFIKISCVFCQGSIPSMPPYFTCVVRGQIYTLIILIELGM